MVQPIEPDFGIVHFDRSAPFENAMRERSRRAALTGIAVGGGLLAVLLIVCLGFYSPCNSFCAHPPTSCGEDLARWRASCETTCRGALHGSFAVDTEVPSGGVMKVVPATLGGGELVDKLNVCVFAGAYTPSCKSAIAAAQSRGLWCGGDGKSLAKR